MQISMAKNTITHIMLLSFRLWFGFFVACVLLAVQLFGFAIMALCIGFVCKDNVLY
jgi:hypothetical protein